MKRNEEYAELATRLRSELPPRVADLFEADIEANEVWLAFEDIFDCLASEDLAISADLADEIWRLAQGFGIMRWDRDSLEYYVRR